MDRTAGKSPPRFGGWPGRGSAKQQDSSQGKELNGRDGVVGIDLPRCMYMSVHKGVVMVTVTVLSIIVVVRKVRLGMPTV